jgi:hypothetical protein
MTRKADSTYSEAARASFATLVQAMFTARPPSPEEAARLPEHQAFIERFGPIIYSRFGKNVPCGVALTDTMAAAHLNLAILTGAEVAGPGDAEPRDTGGKPAGSKPAKVPRRVKQLRRKEQQWWMTQLRRPVRLHLVLPMPANAQILTSLSKCGTQAVYARRFLQDEDLRQCLTLLYWPADTLIALADEDAAGPAPAAPAAGNTPDPPQPPPAAPAQKAATDSARTYPLADVVSKQLDTADQYYQHFTQRTIRVSYFQGIGYGMLAIVVLFVLFYVFRGSLKVPVTLLWSIMAGALGALTSVLSSATFGRIVLDRTQGGTWNTFLGAFRPIIGALFGAAFFTLINAGFLPVKIPSSNQIALYASIAFLAGFSHRWAQDTLKTAEGKIAPPSNTPGSSADQESTAKPAQH